MVFPGLLRGQTRRQKCQNGHGLHQTELLRQEASAPLRLRVGNSANNPGISKVLRQDGRGERLLPNSPRHRVVQEDNIPAPQWSLPVPPHSTGAQRLIRRVVPPLRRHPRRPSMGQKDCRRRPHLGLRPVRVALPSLPGGLKLRKAQHCPVQKEIRHRLNPAVCRLHCK